ncbi:chemotaxis protein CheB [Lederbergia wuyishanensis]|uniref:protein-glutamate methylesterase n=1 Tax=Lederbergia wuyishanensis TaxID=1347903 RepID=A0ABU0CZS4_9BACI|nr:chemotaxis protein CheB [Lederbergia wuyishanensis]MCJ8006284.1 chemotaxis protein CheB [Lederbergia wuyishanensis]MDQ0341653.1 two-component system chemotaxis response regulator CheB [Lederbergia wuyishanensis]
MTSRIERHRKKIICIGTSTGGPRALQAVLSQLPKELDASIVIVQHMPPKFTKSLADRLNTLCEIDVKEAEDGELLKEGTAYIAPGGRHMTIVQIAGKAKVKVLDSPPVNGHRPSVDVMFNSIHHLINFDKIAVIMTGMGSDGAAGLIELKKENNVYAIAESEETCIVYGMPNAAVATMKVDAIAKLDDIAETILTYMKIRT